MKIGVLGAGAMAGVLGRRWHAAGHDIFLGSRNVERARGLAERLGPGVGHGTLREAAEFADVTLLAIWPTGVINALLAAGASDGVLAGHVIIDCNNPVETSSFTVTTGEVSLAEQIARLAPGAAVVKAFNQCQVSVWDMQPPAFDGRRLAVPFCGDDSTAKSIVAGLIADLGCRPVDIGPLHRARHLEAMAAVVIGLLFGGADPLTVFNLVDSTSPDEATPSRRSLR